MGRMDDAFQHLERWFTLDPTARSEAKKDPNLVSLHGDERWTSMLGGRADG